MSKKSKEEIDKLPKMFIFTTTPVHEVFAFASMTETVAIEVERRIQYIRKERN